MIEHVHLQFSPGGVGVDGTQACVEACPKKVLKVVDKLPLETGGYEVDLAPPAPKGGFPPPGARGAKPKPKEGV